MSLISGYLIMHKSEFTIIALVIVSFLLTAYFGYYNYHDKQRLERDNLALTSKIEQLQHTIARNNQIIADNERSKRELENESISRQEQINEQLSNNDCANQLVPVAVSDSLYNRAKGIRQPTDTSTPAK